MPLNAAQEPHPDDMKKDFITLGLTTSLAAGVLLGAGTLGVMYKSFQWARHEHGSKKYIGITVLTSTALIITLGFFSKQSHN